MAPKFQGICTIGMLMAAAALVLAPPERAEAQDNVDYVELFKGIERIDGAFADPANPYEFEACVGGSGVTGVTVTVPTEPTRDETLLSEGFGEFCLSSSFASPGALDTDFPNGVYEFSITTVDGSDSKSVSFDASEPKGYLDITAPVDGATGVDSNSDLSVTWTLTQKVAGCIAGGDCGDGIAFFLIEEAADEDVVQQLLAIDATGFVVDAAILQPGILYTVEAATYNGVIDFGAMTDGGDAIELINLWGDLNAVTITTAADIEFVELFKVLVRDDGVPDPVDPYEFEACVGGVGVTGAILIVPTTPSPRFEMLSDLGYGEFCIFPSFGSLPALDTEFPNGLYTFIITTVDGIDSKSVDFDASEPEGYLDITAPADGATGVDSDTDLSIGWTLTEKVGSCIAGGTCGEGIGLFVVDETQFGEDVVEELLAIGATGYLVDAAVLQAGIQYTIEAETYNGLIDPAATTDGGDVIELLATFEDINVIGFTTAADIEFVELFKLVDRYDGALVSMPYEFEACVGGGGITGATITFTGNPNPPYDLMSDPEEDDFCFSQEFGTPGDLDTAFPNAVYTFEITTIDGTDSKAVDFDFAEPEGYLDITAPVDGANVPDDSDLSVTWTLTEKVVGCIIGGTCGDGILFFLIDQFADQDVVIEQLAIDDPGTIVPAVDLVPDTDYGLEIETYNGVIDFSGSEVTTSGDSIEQFITIWEDINFIHFRAVPEPGALLQQLSGFAALAALAWRRKRLRQASASGSSGARPARTVRAT